MIRIVHSSRESRGPVTVVGAGPAGLACAIVLARAGRKVIVREANPTVGGRFHGDFQGLENWSTPGDVLDELASAGLHLKFDSHPVREGIAWDAWGERYQLASKQPLYYLVRRGSEPGTLDHALLRQAELEGVEIQFGERVKHISGTAVLSTGPRRADVIAVGYVFRTRLDDGAWIAFDSRVAPLGYAYLLVRNGRGTLASCMFTGFKQQETYLARTRDFFQKRVGLEMQEPRRFGGYGNIRLPRTGLQGGHPVIGEQAGFQDALAGFGMRYALRSGILAARSLLEGRNYSRLWWSELLPQFRRGITNRFLVNILGDRAWRWILRERLAPSPDVRAELGRMYRPSLLTNLVFPFALWRYRAPLSDPSCNHAGCECVWCTCDGSLAASRTQSWPGVIGMAESEIVSR